MPLLWNCVVYFFEVCICWDDATFKGKHGFDKRRNTRVAFGVSDVTLKSADVDGLFF